MSSSEFQSQTTAILASLQQKISKYLTPSYEASDIFDKSKAIKKDHEKAIQFNKQFVKHNQKQTYKKNQQQSKLSQFDQLMYRRKLCQAKLHQMLFNLQTSEPYQGQFFTNKLQQNKLSFKPYDDDFMSFSTLKQAKSEMILTSTKEPNFLSIEKELHSMQKKLQNLQKKINKSNSKRQNERKSIDENKQKELSKKSTSTKKQVKLKSQENFGISLDRFSSRKHQYSFKKSPSQKIIRKSSSIKNRQNSQQVLNRHKNHKCQQKIDQTSLNNKLIQENKKKTESKTGLNQSKLRKVGFSRFNQQSKKNIFKAKNAQQKTNEQKMKYYQTNIHKSQNRIKLNILKTQSEQVL